MVSWEDYNEGSSVVDAVVPEDDAEVISLRRPHRSLEVVPRALRGAALDSVDVRRRGIDGATSSFEGPLPGPGPGG